MNEQPRTISLEGSPVAVTFVHNWMTIDPRKAQKSMVKDRYGGNQDVTICILRPLVKGALTTFSGVAVRSPRDEMNERTGQVLALARAIRLCNFWLGGEMLFESEARRIARRWFFEQDQAAKVAEVAIPVEA